MMKPVNCLGAFQTATYFGGWGGEVLSEEEILELHQAMFETDVPPHDSTLAWAVFETSILLVYRTQDGWHFREYRSASSNERYYESVGEDATVAIGMRLRAHSALLLKFKEHMRTCG